MTVADSSKNSYRAAGFFRRLAAAMLDVVFLLPVFGIVFVGLFWVFGQGLPTLREMSPDLFLAFVLDQKRQRFLGIGFLFLIALIGFFYDFVFHAVKGQTFGEWCVRMKVIDSYGQRPGLLRSFLRAVLGLLSFCLAGVGLLWIGFDQEKRGLHDKIAGTYAVLTS